MANILTPGDHSELMGRIRGVDTKPELSVRRAFHALGYRYRTYVREFAGNPGLALSRRRAVNLAR